MNLDALLWEHGANADWYIDAGGRLGIEGDLEVEHE